jgi:hypothetical protein
MLAELGVVSNCPQRTRRVGCLWHSGCVCRPDVVDSFLVIPLKYILLPGVVLVPHLHVQRVYQSGMDKR